VRPKLKENFFTTWYQQKTGLVYAFRSLKRCCVPQHCGEMSMKWHSLYTLKSYFKCIKLCNILQFSPSCCTNVFFTAPAVLLKFTFLCIGIFIGILPETRYFLLAFYRYFRENLNSVIFLRPWWQPWEWFNLQRCELGEVRSRLWSKDPRGLLYSH